MTSDTTRANAAFFAPAIVGLPIMVVVLSVCGNLYAYQVPLLVYQAWLVMAPLLSMAITWRYRVEIRSLWLAEWRGAVSAHIIGLVSAALVLLPHIANGDLGYFEFMNGEFMNYAEITSTITHAGYAQELVHFAIAHARGRDGIDFLNVQVTLLTQQVPMHIVQLTSALLRYLACSMVFYIVYSILASVPSRLIWSTIFTIVLVFCPLDLFHYMVSYMAANFALPVAIGYLAMLASCRDRGWVGIIPMIVASSLFLLVTYVSAEMQVGQAPR